MGHRLGIVRASLCIAVCILTPRQCRDSVAHLSKVEEGALEAAVLLVRAALGLRAIAIGLGALLPSGATPLIRMGRVAPSRLRRPDQERGIVRVHPLLTATPIMKQRAAHSELETDALVTPKVACSAAAMRDASQEGAGTRTSVVSSRQSDASDRGISRCRVAVSRVRSQQSRSQQSRGQQSYGRQIDVQQTRGQQSPQLEPLG